jgi:hypothetical protein
VAEEDIKVNDQTDIKSEVTDDNKENEIILEICVRLFLRKLACSLENSKRNVYQQS